MGCEFQKRSNKKQIPFIPIYSTNEFNQTNLNALRQEHFKRWHPMRRLVIHPPEKRKPANGKK